MSTTASGQFCPVCDAEVNQGAEMCVQCKTDMEILAPPAQVALHFYNAGVDLARAGDRSGAELKMRGAVAADPEFVDAFIVLGKLLAQSGKTSDLEQAIACWERARSAKPTESQSEKLGHCIDSAKAGISSAGNAAQSKQRNRTVRMVAGGGLIALACGIGGYLLRPLHPLAGAPSSAAGGRPIGPIIGNAESAPKDPIAAINLALKRPDITVGRNGRSLVLHGSVQSDAEKRMTIATSAYAAGVEPGVIDAADLHVVPKYSPIAAKRVEHMLHQFVIRISSGHDPLRFARLSVSGGEARSPLKVTGTVIDYRAAAELKQLIKEVYPSANSVDVSGLVLLRNIRRPVRRARRVVEAVPSIAADGPVVVKARMVSVARSKTNPSSAGTVSVMLAERNYTVQPGDTIFGITHKYGRKSAQWHDLWAANRHMVHRPGSIPSGTVLKLPAGWKAAKTAIDAGE